MSELKLKALKARYTAQRLEALATIEVYMSNSVGIGEHPQIIDEIDKLVRSVDEADGLLKTLNSIFKVEEVEETKYSGEKEAPKQPEN
jgi:hypothetical protein